MASANSQQVQSGHMVRIFVGGKTIGWARTSSMAQNYGTEGVYVLGDVAPVEHVSQRFEATITLDEFVIHRSALADAVQLLDISPMGPEEQLAQGVLDFQILGRNDEVMMTYEECTPVNYSYQVAANQFSGQNATFTAKRVVRGPSFIHKGEPSQGIATETPGVVNA